MIVQLVCDQDAATLTPIPKDTLIETQQIVLDRTKIEALLQALSAFYDGDATTYCVGYDTVNQWFFASSLKVA